jgi:hypothetical protein
MKTFAFANIMIITGFIQCQKMKKPLKLIAYAQKFALYCYFGLTSFQIISAQNNDYTLSISSRKEALLRIVFNSGKFLKKRGPFINSIDENGKPFNTTNAISIEYGWQTLGGEEWHQVCNYPIVGVGAKYMYVIGRNEMGDPFSVYGFFNGNFFRTKSLRLTSKIAAGIAYGFTIFDPNDQLPNDLLGSKLNFFTELGVGLDLRLYNSLYIEPGLRFSHYSNGNMYKPQKGVNISSYSLTVRSNLQQNKETYSSIPLSKNRKKHEVLTYVGMATRQVDFIDNDSFTYHETYGLHYLMANLHCGYNYALTRRYKVGLGFDIIYDGTNGQIELAKTRIPTKSAIPNNQKIGLMTCITGESTIAHLSFFISLGYMVALHQFEGTTPRIEQRVGLKYHILPNLFAGVNVRAYKFQYAKAMEFNVGYRHTL